jgi:hypothetical protein
LKLLNSGKHTWPFNQGLFNVPQSQSPAILGIGQQVLVQSPNAFQQPDTFVSGSHMRQKMFYRSKITNRGPHFKFSELNWVSQLKQIPEAITRACELVSESLSDLTDYQRADALLTVSLIFRGPTPCSHFPDHEKAIISTEYGIRESSSLALTSHGLPEKT